MKTKSWGIALGLLLLSSSAMATQNNWWKVITTSKDYEAAAKLDTIRITKLKNGDQVLLVTTRISAKKTGKVHLQQHYVRGTDCEQQQGKVGVVDMDGKFLTENDFAFGAGNNDSAVAEFICEMYEEALNDPGQTDR